MIRNLQRIQIKVGTEVSPAFNLDPFMAIFARWRKDKLHPAEWVDLADYAHMLRGPGIVLVGQRCNFAMDLSGPGPGILYAAKKGLSGSYTERVLSAFKWCFDLANLLAAENEFPKDLRLRTDLIELRFNDRLETPNNAATDSELQPIVRQVLDTLFGAENYELIPQADPAQTYGFSIAANKAEHLDLLLERAAASAHS